MAAVADPPEAPVKRVTPLEPRPPSMAPGLGTIGGAPTDADSPARPPDAEAKPAPPQTPAPAEPKPPSMAPGSGTPGGAPVSIPKEFIPPKAPADWPDKPVETKTDKGPPSDWPDKPVQAKSAPQPAEAKSQPADWPDKPVEQAPQPAQSQPSTQPQPPESPMPSGTGAGAQQGMSASLIPGRDAHINALVASGKTPGEAQAIADGQQPKTLNGEAPQSKPAPAPKTEQQQQKDASGYLIWAQTHPGGTMEEYQADPNAPAGPKPGELNKPSEPSAATTTTEEPPKVVEGNKIQGTSTVFGLNYDGSPDPDDNGRGFFGGVNTRNPNLKAVAVPVDVLEKVFGHFAQLNAQGTYDMVDTPEARAIVKQIQSAHVEAIGADGKIHKFPIVDIQGSLAGHPGKVLDLTYGATKEMGFTDNHNISYQIIGGDGKPYPIPDNIEFAAGGGGKGGEGGGAGGGGAGDIGLVPVIPTIPPSGSARRSGGYESPSGGGGEGDGGGRGASSVGAPGPQATVDIPSILGGVGAAAIGSLFGRGGGGPSQAPAEEEPPPPGGIKAANVLGVRTISPGPPPPAPSSLQAQLLPPPAAPSVPSTGPQPALPPLTPLKGPDPAVVKALMKRGFTRAQAEAFAAKATVSKPGAAAITGGASKPATQPSGAPPAKPQLPAPSAKAPVPAKQAPPAAPAATAPSPSEIESASHNMRPLGYRAAVRLPNGEVFSGPEHAHALDNAAENASMRVNDATTHYGFVDKNQHFISMAEADRLLEKNWYKQRNLPEPASLAPPAPPAPAELPQPQKKEKLTRFQRSEQAMRQMIAEREAKAAPGELEATRIGSEGSTIGVPNPPGGPSPDDPRVKKQKDNLTKGEHFVPGDDFHDQLLSGLPGGHGGRQRQILGQAEQAISDKSPLHISYISAPKEAAKFPTRESRTVQYEAHSPEARLMGTTEGQLVGHSMIPVSVGISPARKAGEPHQSYIQGLSTNILANNFQHVNDKLAAIGRKTPYQQLGQKFFNDLEGYFANLNAGHTATGRGYVLGTEDHPSEPDRDHVPYKLSRSEADFIGTVLNNTAAFAKHGDAEKLRELARVNGTLITPEGETNRLRHQIEQHEPGWRQRVLEPSIRSFKTGLVHEVHPSEETMPATIRPGKEYQQLTKALARTSERGRPDVPVAASLHHTFADNKAINQIERDFSEERINEAEARERLKALGEDPTEYKFVGGSGGLITPYEDDGEQISPAEHTELKSNLRKQWIGGKMPIEDYRRKVAEVPLPTKPSQSAVPSEEGRGEPEISPSSPIPALPRHATPRLAEPSQAPPSRAVPRDLSKTASSIEPLAETHEETSETPAPAPKPATPIPKPKPEPKAPQEPPEEPVEPKRPPEAPSASHYVSPNVKEGTDLAGALKQVQSQPHKKARDFYQRVEDVYRPEGGGTVTPTIGNWEGTAEGSSWTHDDKDSLQDARTKAALKGLHSAQKGTAAFHYDEAGPDRHYDIDFPEHSHEEADKLIAKHGFSASTIHKTPEGLRAHLIDPGGENYEHALQLAAEAKAKSPIARRGTAAFDGGDDRPAAAEAYRRILGESGIQIRGSQGGISLRGHGTERQHPLQSSYEEAEDNYERLTRGLGEAPASSAAPPPAPTGAAKKVGKEPPPPRPISAATQKVLGPQPKNKKQAKLWQQAGERLDTQVPEGIPLEVDRGEKGKFKTDPKGKVLYKKVGYDIANSPLLQKHGKALGQELNKKTGKMGMAKPPAETEDDLESLDPEKRLSPFLNPTDRKRVSHLNDISAVDTYADELYKMYKGIEDLPEVMKGKNWYDEAVGLLRQHFGSHADLMANLLGATSAGNAVKINYNMALDAYHQFLRGHYDEAIKLYNQAYDIKQSGKGALMKHITDNGIHEALGEEAPDTDEAAMAQWIEHHNLTPRAANGKLFGHNSIQVLKVLAHNWEEQAGGPKTPNFAANLNGRSMQATIDMWAARTMRRLGFEGHTSEPWMIQPAGETGVHNVDFGLSQLAFKKAADKIGIKPSALQAILWFAEQKEWQKRGWEREQDPDERDYRPMLKKYQRPGDITEAQGAKFHPSVPELEARLKGAPGVLHMDYGGLVPQPPEVPPMMTLGGAGQPSSSPLLGQTTAPAAPDLTPAPRALPANTPAPRALPAQTPAVTTGPADYPVLGQTQSGLATNFGHDINGNPDQYMLKTLGPSSHIGAFGADVTNPQTVGVSLPKQTIQDNIGNYQKNAQIRRDIANGRYQVVVNAPNGKSGMFHIVDVGPGPNEPGKIDITGSAMKQLGVTGNFNANFHIVDTGAGQAQSVRGYQEGGLVT